MKIVETMTFRWDTVLNFVLILLSALSIFLGVYELCTIAFWRWLFIVFAAIIFCVGWYFVFHEQWIDCITPFLISIGLVVALFIRHSSDEDATVVCNLWKEYRQEKEMSVSLTPLEAAAYNNSDAYSQYLLAKNHFYGIEGYLIDYPLAKDIAQKSADNGYPPAHILLSEMYLQGRGCKTDTTQAISNLILAMKNGMKDLSSSFVSGNIVPFESLSKKDKELISRNQREAFWLDSLITEYNSNLKGTSPLPFVDYFESHIPHIELLSSDGFIRAMEIIFIYESILKNNDKLQSLSHQFIELGLIPDEPMLRHLFFSYADGSLSRAIKYDKAFVDTAIARKDFISMAMQNPSMVKKIEDLFLRYEYCREQYERASFLVNKQNELYNLSLIGNRTIESYYQYALDCYEGSIFDLSEAIQRRNNVFVN